MAGETPGANAPRRRRPLRWEDDRSTDKIYASGQPSALGSSRTVADSTVKPNSAPAGVPTPVQRIDDNSADKYYATGSSDRRAAAKAFGPRRAKSQPGRKSFDGEILISRKEDVQDLMAALATRLKGGEKQIVVTVEAGNSEVLKRTRAALEAMVTRQAIDEAEYHEVRIVYATPEPPPVPSKTIRVEDNGEADLDPMDFLNGPGPQEPSIDTSAVVPVEVDVAALLAEDGQPISAGGPPWREPTTIGDQTYVTPPTRIYEVDTTPIEEATEDDDGADNAFLDPEVEAAKDPIADEAPAEPEAAPEEAPAPESKSARRKRGK